MLYQLLVFSCPWHFFPLSIQFRPTDTLPGKNSRDSYNVLTFKRFKPTNIYPSRENTTTIFVNCTLLMADIYTEVLVPAHQVTCLTSGWWSVVSVPTRGPGADTPDNGGAFTSVMTTAPCLVVGTVGQPSGKFRAVGRKSDPVTRSYGHHKFCVIATEHP